MAMVALVNLRPAMAEPGDIFTIAAPAVTDRAPAASDIMPGDASVSTQTGALNYSFPIRTPPGRNGMQPSLSLAHSSQSPVYGQVASHWSLAGVQMITEDTSLGRISTAGKRFTSSLSGGRPLIAVDDEEGQGTRYRAANDSSWIRYERHTGQAFHWRAYAPDGTTYYFGDSTHTTGCSNISDGYAPLTRVVDSFGNSIDYMWRPGVADECRLQAITWGHNAAASVGYFAAIELDYTIVPQPCELAGSQTVARHA